MTNSPSRNDGNTVNDQKGEIIDVGTLNAQLPRGARIIGLDLGTKTIGLAVSDARLTLASPRKVIKRTKFMADLAIIKTLIEAENIGAVVLGLPLNMDGSEGPRAQATRAFARNMMQHVPLPVVLWDERLSTVAAERSLLEQDVSRAKRAERIDSAAASFILQGVLDRLYSAATTDDS
ncbi:Holliday junction resolvase RuvX [Ahrensia sp. 13_GOM-1096m]|uniref:Holliday junction resolvase RuvX n=1 Tax=Ahrensia sp. 13_GOM-1096m TaxID=1380380 RepID=UPI00047BF9E6|nr:Holliday junction resolvase RuvX [Ahrensia sp. 13_GOM-1096m]